MTLPLTVDERLEEIRRFVGDTSKSKAAEHVFRYCDLEELKKNVDAEIASEKRTRGRGEKGK